MRNIISQAALAIAIAAGGLAAAPLPAAAQSFELQIGPDGVRPIIREERRDDRRYERDRDRGREQARRSGCSQREALAIARSEGLRRAEVVRTTQRSITVEGDTRRGPVVMRFANVRGCPSI